MSKITVDLIQKLRERSGVGMMDCRKALEEAAGDIEQAVCLLRKKGVSVAAKRSDNLTENGLVNDFVGDNFAAIAELSCETDFSARNESMREFAKKVCQSVKPEIDLSNLDNLLSANFAETEFSVQAKLNELIGQVCENIKIASAKSFKINANNVVNTYVHPDHSVGCMVEIQASRDLIGSEKEEIKTLAKEICMQVAVNKPLAVRSSEIAQSLIDNEKEIARTQLAQTTKPQTMWDMIIDGKLKKFFEDVCLLNQKFIKDDSVTIQQKIDSLAKKLGVESLTLVRFARIGIKR